MLASTVSVLEIAAVICLYILSQYETRMIAPNECLDPITKCTTLVLYGSPTIINTIFQVQPSV